MPIVALVLIIAGVLLLGVNLGFITGDVWWMLLRLWPLLIVAFGVELIVRGRPLGLRIAGAVAVLALVGAGLGWQAVQDGSPSAEVAAVQELVDGADRAELTLEVGVGRLHLGGGGDAGAIVDGTVDVPGGSEFTVERGEDDGTAAIRLTTETRGWSPFRVRGPTDVPRWDLRLGSAVPMTLHVDTGVGESNLDLRGSPVEHIVVDGGVGRTTVVVPDRGEVTAEVRGGVGELLVRIPEGVAVRIRAESGLGSLDISGPWDEVAPGEHRSEDWETADDRVELQISAGVGRLDVRQVDR